MILLGLLAALQGGPRDAAPPGLAAALDARIAALEDDPETEVTVGVAITTLGGQAVYSWNADRLFVLASDIKLLTTGAALLRLPWDYRWRTEARLQDGVLWLRGNGDPSLRDTADGNWAEKFLDGLASAVRAAGGGHLRELVLDDRAFDRRYRPGLWPEDQWSADYCAGVSALWVQGGCELLRLPGDGSARLLPELEPPLQLELHPEAQGGLELSWKTPDQVARVRGDLQRPGSEPIALAVADPLEQFRRFLAAGLRRRGVSTDRLRLAAAGEQAPAGEPVFVWPSAWTLAEAITVINKDSDNAMAEALLKTLAVECGRPGTTADGVAAVRATLESAGLNPANYLPADGSGMGRSPSGDANRSTPAALCALLQRLSAHPQGRVLFHSLPVAGTEAKLKDWFTEPCFQPQRVHAKTGYITGASSLSGYVLAPDDTVLVFAVAVNFTPKGEATSNRNFRQLQEDVIAEVLRRWSAR